jgi:hypothetical protein
MSEEQNVAMVGMGSIQCDNDSCDYYAEEVSFEEYGDWVNKPCPKCGENLLTPEDFLAAQGLMQAMELMNALSPEELKEITDLAKEHSSEISEALGVDLDAIPDDHNCLRLQSDTKGGISIKGTCHKELSE